MFNLKSRVNIHIQKLKFVGFKYLIYKYIYIIYKYLIYKKNFLNSEKFPHFPHFFLCLHECSSHLSLKSTRPGSLDTPSCESSSQSHCKFFRSFLQLPFFFSETPFLPKNKYVPFSKYEYKLIGG